MQRSWMRLFWTVVVVVGVGAGYVVSSGMGTRLLHREIETQLTRLLEGPVSIESVAVGWDEGLRIEARELAAYPTARPDPDFALRARRIVTWVDLFALVIGRLELGTLILEGPELWLERTREGTWVGLPLPARADYPDEGLEDRHLLERVFAGLAALDGGAARIADGFRAADRIIVMDGALEWRSPDDENGEGVRLRAENVHGNAGRDWISGDLTIDFRGVLLDGVHEAFPFTLGVHRPDGRHFSWELGLDGIPLALAGSPLTGLSGVADVTGTLDTRFRLSTEDGRTHQLDFDGAVRDATIALNQTETPLEGERIELAARFEIDPVEIRLLSSHARGTELTLEFQGSVHRPIDARAETRVEARTRGIELQRVRQYADSLAEESRTALTLSRLTERVIGGRIDHIEVAGSTSLEGWFALATGKSLELPEGFAFGVAFEEVSLGGGPGDRIEGLSGQVEWLGDQIVLREGRGRYRGRGLPRLEVVIDGISSLALTRPEEREITRAAPPLPGLGPLASLLRPRDPDSLPPIKRVGFALDQLEHPLFRWPLRDVELLLEPLRRGMELTVRKGRWGGANLTGEVAWFSDPDTPSVSAKLSLSAPAPAEPSPSAPVAGSGPASGEMAPIEAVTMSQDRWGEGHFEAEFRPRPWLPFERAAGLIRLEGDRIFLDDLEIHVQEQGTFAARIDLGLDRPDSVGFDASFALTEGRLKEIGPFFALPQGLASGSIEGAGSIGGRVRPDASFIAELRGSIRAEARAGTIQTSLPLLLRLAKATEGYNPFASENRLAYETMTGTFLLEDGLVSIEDFEIEGPLRIYARADLDTNPTPATIHSVVGIFLFRKPSALLESLPLIRSFLPGSERGLIGTYFEVDGVLGDPEVSAMPMETLMSSVPDAIKAPFKALRFLFEGGGEES